MLCRLFVWVLIVVVVIVVADEIAFIAIPAFLLLLPFYLLYRCIVRRR